MTLGELKSVQKDLFEFVEEFAPFLGRKDRHHWCGTYLSGLMLEGERKSIEPMALRMSEHGNVQAMQQFVNQSPWPFEPIQIHLAELLVKKFGLPSHRRNWTRKTPGALILDDTTFPKQGTHSVGVSQQWSGQLGKTTNCQTLVSWHYADPQRHFPVRAELFLPESWTTNPNRLIQSGVPGSRFEHREKWRIGLDLLESVRHLIPHQVILTDAGYGINKDFLNEIDVRGELYIAQIPSSRVFWPYGVKVIRRSNRSQKDRFTGMYLKNRFVTVEAPEERPLSAEQWAKKLIRHPPMWRHMKLPSASATTQKNHEVKVTCIRVRLEIPHYPRAIGEEAWLMIEHHLIHPSAYAYGNHTEETIESFKYYVSNMPRTTSTKKLFELSHLRWKIEQGYQQLKEELGMDHFEGRSWTGFHHHVTLCMMAYGFIQIEREKLIRKEAKKKTPASNVSRSQQCVAG